MKESNINNKILKVIFGFLILGGVVTIFNIFHTAKDKVHSFEYANDVYDGDIFV